VKIAITNKAPSPRERDRVLPGISHVYRRFVVRWTYFNDSRAHAADIRAISGQRNHPLAADILLKKVQDALAPLISKCALMTGNAWPLQHDAEKEI